MDGSHTQKCYASELGECSAEISKEHYFSRGILEHLSSGSNLDVSGFPWQDYGTTNQPSLRSLTAKVLCRKHNSELNALDSEALRLFQGFRDIDCALSSKSKEDLSVEIQGDLFERWILKVLIGVIASGNIAKNNQRIAKSKPPLVWLRLLFGLEEFPDEWGLYLISQIGERPMQKEAIGFAPMIHETRVIGALCHIYGFRFLLCMSRPARNRVGTYLENALYRPSYLQFAHATEAIRPRIDINWKTPARNEGFQIEYTPSSIQSQVVYCRR